MLFIHGFPDSPAMFAAYYTPAERREPWLRGRSVYTIALPNRQDNRAGLPSLDDLRAGRLGREFAALVDAVLAASPTGRVVLVAHDWGATFSWELVRRRPDLPVEAMVSLSVGSSFRYDLREHGPSALLWLYNCVFGLPYYLPIPAARRLQSAGLRLAGYRSDTLAEAYLDSFHYWDWPQRLRRLPGRLLGEGAEPPFTNIRFPVLYVRTALDRIATTGAFERHLRATPGSRVVHYPRLNHWFPEQHSELLLREIRAFEALRHEVS